MPFHDQTRLERTRPYCLAEILAITARHAGDRPGLIHQDSPLTYRTLFDRMLRVAAFLRLRGVRPGDRVALQSDNRPEFAYITGGVILTGAILVTVNVMYLEEEIRQILEDSGARTFFLLEEFLPRIRSSRTSLATLKDIILIGRSTEGFASLDDALDCEPLEEIAYRSGDDLVLLQYTSGTTGRPKGAMISHKNIVSCLDMMANTRRGGIKDTDVLLLALPLFHCYGLILGLFGCLVYGMTTILVNRFDPVEIFRLIEKYRATIFFGAPTMYIAFVNTPNLDQFDVSSLSKCGSGAAPLPVTILERFREMTGIEIQEGYGLTESSPVVSTNINAEVNRPGTVGYPIPGVQVRIVDERGKDCAIRDVGELIVKGDNIFLGYWNNETATREAIRDGWFHTGDMGSVDEDGYYRIVDRKKDMILVSGYNVYPIEVENVLFQHPMVADAAVVGIPHPYQGESIAAFVVARAGSTPEEQDILKFTRERLAAFKVPKSVVLVDSLPKNRTGKVLKRVLRNHPALQMK